MEGWYYPKKLKKHPGPAIDINVDQPIFDKIKYLFHEYTHFICDFIDDFALLELKKQIPEATNSKVVTLDDLTDDDEEDLAKNIAKFAVEEFNKKYFKLPK